MRVVCNIIHWFSADPFNPSISQGTRSTLRTGGEMAEDKLPEWIQYAETQHTQYYQSFLTRVNMTEWAGFGLSTQIINIDTGEVLFNKSQTYVPAAKNKTVVNKEKQAELKKSKFRSAIIDYESLAQTAYVVDGAWPTPSSIAADINATVVMAPNWFANATMPPPPPSEEGPF